MLQMICKFMLYHVWIYVFQSLWIYTLMSVYPLSVGQYTYLEWTWLNLCPLYFMLTIHPLTLYHVVIMMLLSLLYIVGLSVIQGSLLCSVHIPILPLLKCLDNKRALQFPHMFFINLYFLPYVRNDILKLLLLLGSWELELFWFLWFRLI